MGIPAHGVFALSRKKKILGAIFVLPLAGGLLIVLAFSPAGWFTSTSGQNAGQLLGKTLPLQLAREAAKDSDGDGLKDWEEAIWRTDIANPDTDGDGTPDGEEVEKNRDPRIAGPNDKNTVTPETGGIETEKPAPENLTAQVGARIATDVLSSINRGGVEPEKLVNAYAGGLAAVQVLDGAEVFSPRDLTPAKENDLLTTVRFLAAIEGAWQKYFKAGQPSDLEVFFNAFENGDGSTAPAELKHYINGYGEAIRIIRTTPVPEELQKTALEFMNYLSRIRRSAELMKSFQTDPLAAMLAVRERLALNEEFDAFIKKAIADAEPVIRNKVAEFAAQQKR